MTAEQGTTVSCPLASVVQPSLEISELEIHFEDTGVALGRLPELPDDGMRTRTELGRLEAELAEERRKRAEAMHELEQLEDRYETVMRERSALDASARTLHDRFRARTERLYRTLLHKEGGIGAQVADATRELMEASEHLIRLQADRDSLIRQVEKLRIALRRANGFEGGPSASTQAAALDAEVVTLFHTFKSDLERRLLSITRGLEDRLDALAGHLNGASKEPAAPGPLDYAVSTRRFYADGSLIEPFASEVGPTSVDGLEAMDRVGEQVMASEPASKAEPAPPEEPAASERPSPSFEAPVPVMPACVVAALTPPVEMPLPAPAEPAVALATPPVEEPFPVSAPAPAASTILVPVLDPTNKGPGRVAPAAIGMERILETRRQLRSGRPSCRSTGVLKIELAQKEIGAERSRVGNALDHLAEGSRLGLSTAVACVAGVVMSLLIASSTIPERAGSSREGQAAVGAEARASVKNPALESAPVEDGAIAALDTSTPVLETAEPRRAE